MKWVTLNPCTSNDTYKNAPTYTDHAKFKMDIEIKENETPS